MNHDYECCKKIHPWRDVHARAEHVFKKTRIFSLGDIEALNSARLRAKQRRIPISVQGWQLLDDNKVIMPVKRAGSCTELGPSGDNDTTGVVQRDVTIFCELFNSRIEARRAGLKER